MHDLLMWLGGLVFTAICAIVGGLLKMIFSRLDKHSENHNALETRLENHRLYVAETFGTKTDIQNIASTITQQLNRIEDKLDKKVDKQ